MSRIYTVQFGSVADTTAADLIELAPADDKPIAIIGLFMSQTSDFGDAQDELLSYKVIRGFTTSGSGGSAPTPRPLEATDPAAGFTAETNNTVLASTGTEEILHSDAFNVRVGEKLWLPDGFEWRCNQTQTRIVVRLNNAPADSLTMNGTVYVRES
jgi:hypothetical protein